MYHYDTLVNFILAPCDKIFSCHPAHSLPSFCVQRLQLVVALYSGSSEADAGDFPNAEADLDGDSDSVAYVVFHDVGCLG